MIIKRFTKDFECPNNFISFIYDNEDVLTTGEVVDLLNELHEDYDKLFKFVVVMNRQINNSIVISDQFKEVWNHVLKKVVGELE